MTQYVEIPQTILDAIKCGPVPRVRPIEDICADPQTVGERVIAFAGNHLIVADGPLIGEPLILDLYQQVFILSVFDNPYGTRFANLSIGARNGKTALLAVILLAFLIGPLAKQNTSIASGAMSRTQASICFDLMYNTLLMSPDCEGLFRPLASKKQLFGLSKNTRYTALSSDAKTGYGQSLRVIVLDEAGQIRGPTSPFTDMLDSRQGSHDDAIYFKISTQGRSDLDFFSVALDTAERQQDRHTISHVYCADKGADLDDESQWYKANPGLGKFRSLKDLRHLMRQAKQIPAKESEARNQYLNQRVAMEGLAITPSIWKECAGEVDLELFRKGKVSMGLDLSARNDLTAGVLCAEDEEGSVVHTLPFVFCPTSGIEERARRDRAPYDAWVRDGYMLPVGGKTMDFDQIAEALHLELGAMGIQVSEIHYDKAYITHFQAACERVGAFQDAEWIGVPQNFKDMGMRLASLQILLAENRLRHGGHPVLAMAASVAVAKEGREGVSALAKNLSTQRIDPIVALVMAAWPFGDGRNQAEVIDVSSWIG
ncbi:terminase TerL endonuclease subunit [Parahaliea mediterranea]|uniref:terminase TerL endonuclease subunit n=1 Tax=Parahaliea mediterranea TaxID=651086 RepID=UPI000E2FAB08|nr:terminase TerL endonuclease subunit [Parahaliea mediterranea]